MSDDLFVFNGVNVSTGDYLLPPMTAQAAQLNEARFQEYGVVKHEVRIGCGLLRSGNSKLGVRTLLRRVER